MSEYRLSYTAPEIDEKLGRIDSLAEKSEIPTKVSELTNDSKFLTSFTESDPPVRSWAKQTNKPSYTKSEVGLGNVDNVKQYSASNPPPYPVRSVNGKTGAITLTNETWTFTLSDGSTVTKTVVTGVYRGADEPS